MPYQPERRRYKRFTIEGARVEFTTLGADRVSEACSGEAPLRNISLAGLSFRFERPIQADTKLKMVLHVPDFPPVRLVGRIRWTGQQSGVPGRVFGVEFWPFDSRPGNNTVEARKQLKELESRFLQADE